MTSFHGGLGFRSTYPTAGRSDGAMPSVVPIKNDGLDELMPFTEDSLSRMQRNVFERLRPLEAMPVAAVPSMGKVGVERGDPMMGMGVSEDPQSRPFKSGGGQAVAAIVDSSRDAKPAISFACLIGMAILDSPNKRLTVSEVYEWMKRSFPYFSSVQAGTGWKNSVRHNLSLNKHFVKQVRSEPEVGSKGSYWCIRPESLPIMEAAIRKQHSPPGVSVSGEDIIKASARRSGAKAAARRKPRMAPRMAASPGTEAKEAASLLFDLSGSTGPSIGASFPSLAFPTGLVGPGRAWSATRQVFPTPPTSARPSSVIKATYNPNAHKGQQNAGFSRAHRRFASDEGSAAMDTMAEQQQPQQQDQRRRTGMASPQTTPRAQGQESQKLFTFTAPMSFRAGTDSRFTPEYNNTWGRTNSGGSADGTDGPTGNFSPGSIRRRLVPLATLAPAEADGMDCEEDATSGAVAALLGLGSRA